MFDVWVNHGWLSIVSAVALFYGKAFNIGFINC